MLHEESANIDFTRKDILYIVDTLNKRVTQLQEKEINPTEQTEMEELIKLKDKIMEQVKAQVYK